MKRLRGIVRRLRRECPWDRKQTVFSVRHNVIEEAYELAEAIRQRDYEKIIEEVGDHLFIALFLSQILEDTGKATFRQVTDGISRKLIRRHPHVFGKTQVRSSEQVLHNWSQIKQQEKKDSVLTRVPKALPALRRAASIQMRAKRVGFDWHDPRDVLAKVVEEVNEIKAELSAAPSAKAKRRIREELGDLLFALVNMARHLNIDAEDTLHQANEKFIRRFQQLEREFARRGKKLNDCTLPEMDAVWEEHKRKKQ